MEKKEKNTRRISQARLEAVKERIREVDWHDLSLIGTELGEMETIRRQPFQFSDFQDALDSGIFSNLTHPVYVFLQTEPVYFNEGIILTVPVLIAYSSAVPPPNLVARDSVQSEDANTRALNPFGGRPEPMGPLHMAWRPYIPQRSDPDVYEYVSNGKVMPAVVALDWEVRQQRAAHYNEMEANAIKFINPYVILPRVFHALEKPEVTSVTFEYEHDGKKYDVVYDKETDDSLAEFIPAYLSDNDLPADCGEEVKELIKEKFRALLKIRDEQWDETMALLAQYTDDQLKLLEEARVYKFYPRHPKYDFTAFVSKRVNRYFKDADEVFGGKKIEREEMSESDIEDFERFEKDEAKRLKDLEIAQEKERRRLEREKMAEIEKNKTKEEKEADRKAKKEAREKAKKEKEAEKKKKKEEDKEKKVTTKKSSSNKKKSSTTTSKKTTKKTSSSSSSSKKTTTTKKEKAKTPKKDKKEKKSEEKKKNSSKKETAAVATTPSKKRKREDSKTEAAAEPPAKKKASKKK